jgi:6,7-dimethyl-8-ribityllumazine synthase
MAPATSKKIVFINSEFNKDYVSALHKGGQSFLAEQGRGAESIETIWVPGALEIPAVVSRLVESDKVDAIITLGAVIRGETTHYELVSENCAARISELSTVSLVPIIFGVLTTENDTQMKRRCGMLEKTEEITGKTVIENHGEYFADAALKMISSFARVQELV